jgi:mRNA interferase HicA
MLSRPQCPAAWQAGEASSHAAGSSPHRYRLPRDFLRPCGNHGRRATTEVVGSGDAGCTVTLGIIAGQVKENQAEIGFTDPSINVLAFVHPWVYTLSMKRRELGWRFLRHGGNHDVWTDGERQEAVPRHPEINERLARVIIARAKARGRS